jgi:DDE superfamily endonuclease.
MAGFDRENTTVLAVVSASGVALPPLIIFSGSKVQTTWRPTVDDPKRYPWIYANDSGWMKSGIFAHTTDLLQPLDVSVFKSVKKKVGICFVSKATKNSLHFKQGRK